MVALDKISSLPLSIHPSWFDRPEYAESEVFCDRRGCECGHLTRSYNTSQGQAVADALYLDGNWHRYGNVSKALLTAPASEPETKHKLQIEMQEVSCEILISQRILKDHAENVFAELAESNKEAEYLGFDVEEPCLRGVPDACTFFQAVQLLKQLRSDAASLERLRHDSALY